VEQEKPVKVMFIINQMGDGGAERVVQTLANYLAQKPGFRVSVVTLHGDGVAKMDREVNSDTSGGDGYPLREGVSRHTLFSRLLSRGVFKILMLPLQGLELARLVKRQDPEVVISFLVRSNLAHCFSQLFGNRKPVIISERNTSDNQYGSGSLKDRVMLGLIRRLYPRADGVIAISRGVKDSLERLGVLGDKVKVIYNPQPLEEIEARAQEPILEENWLPRDGFTLVTTGRLVEQKDHATLLRAFALVKEEVERASLMVMGEGPLKEDLQRMARDLGIGEKVWFAGWRENPFAIMKRSDLFVFSSKFEGLGNAIIEAMACGLPVIATDCPSGPAEILESGKYGVLVPVGDAEAMAREIVFFYRDPSRREKYARLSRERAGEFAVEKISREYRDFAASCIKKKPGGI